MSTSVRERVYVAVGRLGGDALAKVVSPVVINDDNLLLGPSRADVAQHRTARTRYWGGAPSRALDEELARESMRPVCVALPPTMNGLLTLCRVCSAALEQEREVHVMHLGRDLSVAPPDGGDPAREIVLDASRAAGALPPVAEWSSIETALAATLWRLWCRRSPVAFSRFCASASPLNPLLANLGRYHTGFFPRLANGAFSLSRLDGLLLRQLSQEWQVPARLYAAAMSRAPQLGAWLSHTGDLYVARRLLAWSDHSAGKIVQRRETSPSTDAEMLKWAFRWSPGAEGILDALPGIEVAPPVLLGGAVAYDPERPWGCRLDSTGIPYAVSSGGRNLGVVC